MGLRLRRCWSDVFAISTATCRTTSIDFDSAAKTFFAAHFRQPLQQEAPLWFLPGQRCGGPVVRRSALCSARTATQVGGRCGRGVQIRQSPQRQQRFDERQPSLGAIAPANCHRAIQGGRRIGFNVQQRVAQAHDLRPVSGCCARRFSMHCGNGGLQRRSGINPHTSRCDKAMRASSGRPGCRQALARPVFRGSDESVVQGTFGQIETVQQPHQGCENASAVLPTQRVHGVAHVVHAASVSASDIKRDPCNETVARRPVSLRG